MEAYKENKAIEYLKEEIKSLEKAKIEFFNEIEDKGWLQKNINELDNDIFYKNTLLNLIEKLQKENEKLKNKVAKRNNELIELEETSEKEFLTKQEVNENYIPKNKIRDRLLVVKDLKSKIDLSKKETPVEFYVLDYVNNLLEELLEEE